MQLVDLNFQGTPEAIGVYLVEGNGELALFETGPSTGLPAIEAALAARGQRLEDLTHITLTHIHLDHAGAAGVIAQRNPNVRIVVHEGAAPILVDPTPLLRSAGRSFGDRLTPLFGDVVAISEKQLVPVNDGESLTIAGLTIDVISTPGHASTHVAYFSPTTGVMFTGDAAGAHLPGTSWVMPTLAPPELDFAAWEQSISRMRARNPKLLAMTHFGLVEKPADQFDALMPGIREMEALAADILTSPDDMDALESAVAARLAAAYTAEGGDVQQHIRSMTFGMPPYLAAQGLVRVFKLRGVI